MRHARDVRRGHRSSEEKEGRGESEGDPCFDDVVEDAKEGKGLVGVCRGEQLCRRCGQRALQVHRDSLCVIQRQWVAHFFAKVNYHLNSLEISKESRLIDGSVRCIYGFRRNGVVITIGFML